MRKPSPLFRFNMKISGRLFAGFGFMMLLLASVVTVTIIKVDGVKETNERIVGLRTPTAMASGTITTEIQSSLASLRGFMLTGNDAFKEERAHVWDDIAHSEAEMDVLSQSWTNPQNVKDWTELKRLMEEFKIAQQKVEDISHTPAEFPAVEVLVNEAAPRAAMLVATITQMIDHEVKHEGGTALLGGDRVQLLGMMADIRGTLGLGLANIRAYLLTGDNAFVEKFDALWAKNEARFADLTKNKHLLTDAQYTEFKEFSTIRAEFAPLPPQMFEIRASKKWNMANYTLVNEAAPLANQLLTILLGPKLENGSRVAGLREDQRALLEKDNENSKHEIRVLKEIQFMLLAIGIIAGSAIAYIVARSIVSPITRLSNTMSELAKNNLDVEVMDRQRRDEVGAMANTVEIFKSNAFKVRELGEETEKLMAESASERSRIVNDLRDQLGETIQAAIKGDFSKRLKIQREGDEFSVIGQQVNELIETVNRGLKETSAVMAALAQKNLSRRAEGNFSGAFLTLKNDTNLVADSMHEVIGQLRDTSGSLKSATAEILEGANDLSERTLKQAATIEETSATMEQLSDTVVESAKEADEANNTSMALSKTAEESGNVVSKATEAMERITESSAKISNVIGMIDDIAFQTNLLALNASVEAARAGEAGKGFAVVAIEVRRLAQSAAEASTEVKQLIEESAAEVVEGSRFVGEVSENLQGMISSIQETSARMQSLASSARDQASSIEEVNAAVRDMDEMTQHNAALVEETNAAIEQTDNQVNELDQIIDVFQMEATAQELAALEEERRPVVREHNQRGGDRRGAAPAAPIAQSTAA